MAVMITLQRMRQDTVARVLTPDPAYGVPMGHVRISGLVMEGYKVIAMNGIDRTDAWSAMLNGKRQ